MARQKQSERKRPKGGADASGGNKPARASGKRKAEEISKDGPEADVEEDEAEVMEEGQGGPGQQRPPAELNRYSKLMQQVTKKQRKKLKQMFKQGASVERMMEVVAQAEEPVVEPVLSTAATEQLHRHVDARNRMTSLLEEVLKPVAEPGGESLHTELMTLEHADRFPSLVAEFHNMYALLPEQRLPLKKPSAKFLGTARRVVLLRHGPSLIGFMVLAVHTRVNGDRKPPPLLVQALHVTAKYLDRGVGPAALHLLVTLALGVRANGLRFNQMIEEDVHPEMVTRWRQWGLQVEPRPIGSRRALRGAADKQEDEEDDDEAEATPPQKLFGIKLPQDDLRRLHEAYTQAQLARYT